LDDADFVTMERLVQRFFSHKIWTDPDPRLNDLRYDNVNDGRIFHPSPTGNARRARDMLLGAVGHDGRGLMLAGTDPAAPPDRG
jgi:hypothetical protein